jgi:DNA polymerase/3'-5' exonuclease PolX
MPNEDPKLSRYLKRKLNLKEAQEEVEHMVKEKVPCLQKVNQACVDEIGNIRQSEQPHHAEPATCSSTSNFNEDEDLNVKYIYMGTGFFLILHNVFIY